MKSFLNLAILAGLVACSPMGERSARNPTGAQFLDQVWVAPEYRGKTASEAFSKVYFAPVAVGNLSRQGWWEAQSAVTQRQLDADARKLAAHFRRALANSAQTQSGRRLTVVGQPGPDTLIIETAITNLVPAKAYWNAGATAAGFVVPGAGLLSAAGSGSITVEGRLRDGNNGKLVANFRDTMKDKMAVVNIDSYTWFGGSQANLEEMAANIAQVLNARPGVIVSQPSRIKLVTY
ncbi:MAG: DUF3313 family protein [Luteolibacter sp.]|jgi:hypothetical protein|nr:DUF3313 family protein [Luteolibacter sp.]